MVSPVRCYATSRSRRSSARMALLVRRAADFITTVSGVLRDVVPAMTLLMSLVHLFASFATSLFDVNQNVVEFLTFGIHAITSGGQETAVFRDLSLHLCDDLAALLVGHVNDARVRSLANNGIGSRVSNDLRRVGR